MRPRGTPPTPSARSSDSAPVGTAATRTFAESSPIFMIEPAPKVRSICVRAPFRAASRALRAFSCSFSMSVFSLSLEITRYERPRTDSLPQLPPRPGKSAPTSDPPLRGLEAALLALLAHAPHDRQGRIPADAPARDFHVVAGRPAGRLDHNDRRQERRRAHLPGSGYPRRRRQAGRDRLELRPAEQPVLVPQHARPP